MKVFLIGYMGSGKSTRGPELAGTLGIPCIDLDEELSARAGMTIHDWFELFGENDFRQAEAELLREFGRSSESFVMATGGGAPVQPGNMAFMNDHGITVYLKVHENELVRRLCDGKSHRPLLPSLDAEGLSEFVRSHLHARESKYEESHLIWSASESATECAARIKRLAPNPEIHSR